MAGFVARPLVFVGDERPSTVRRWMPTGEAQLPDDPVEPGGASLGATDVVVGASRVPEGYQRPTIRAVMEQAPEGHPHLDGIDPLVAGARHRCAQDAERQID